MFGLSSSLTWIGLILIASGVVLLFCRKNKKTAIALLIAGGLLIIVPVSLIFLLAD
jgi:LPXTG-motif cell wall-anchored protein